MTYDSTKGLGLTEKLLMNKKTDSTAR